MALFSSSSPPPPLQPLQPFDSPLGLDRNFCVGQQIVLIINRPSLGHDCEVADANGVTVVLCSTHLLTAEKEIQNPTTGQTVFTLRNEFASRSTYGVDPAGRQIMEIKPRANFGKTELYISFIDTATTSPVELVLSPSDGHFSDSADLTLGDRTVARITKELGIMSLPPFSMAVAPGVDLALMSAICIAYATILQRRRN